MFKIKAYKIFLNWLWLPISLLVMLFTCCESDSTIVEKNYSKNNEKLDNDIFSHSKINNLRIDFLDPNYHEILVDSFFKKNNYYVAANLYINEDYFDSVGVKYKGNSSFILSYKKTPKVPLSIDLNKFIKHQKKSEISKIRLSNCWTDPTYMKEVIASSIYDKYLPTPRASFTNVFIDNQFIGLYNMNEHINKRFFKKTLWRK